LIVEDSAAADLSGVDLVFSALPSAAAVEIEPKYAQTTGVISTSSAFRMENDTPILLGPVNAQHAELLEFQQQNRGWRGFLAPKPNCVVAGLATTLRPILRKFGVRRVTVTTMQAISGAGLSPGVKAMDMLDNIIPHIPREEEKVEKEPKKILGELADGRIEPASFRVSATCTRVPVLNGHLMSVSVQTRRPVRVETAREAFRGFAADRTAWDLPSFPTRMITVVDEQSRPQPRLDRDRDGGMTVTVGRLRSGEPDRLRYVGLVHNTQLGAAKGAVLTAEYLVSRFLGWR